MSSAITESDGRIDLINHLVRSESGAAEGESWKEQRKRAERERERERAEHVFRKMVYGKKIS